MEKMGRKYLQYLDVGLRIILEWVFKKCGEVGDCGVG
jgi:hypothetical protein